LQFIFEIKQSLFTEQGKFVQKRDGMSNKVIYKGDRSLLIDWRYLEYKSFQAFAPCIDYRGVIIVHFNGRRRVRPTVCVCTRNKLKNSSTPLRSL